MPECSERNCIRPAIRLVTIHAESDLTDRKYKIWINLCAGHYKLEKESGSIIDEIRKFRPTKIIKREDSLK